MIEIDILDLQELEPEENLEEPEAPASILSELSILLCG